MIEGWPAGDGGEALQLLARPAHRRRMRRRVLAEAVRDRVEHRYDGKKGGGQGCGAALRFAMEVGELSVLETKGAVAPNRAVARPRAPRSGADGAAQRR